MAAAFHSLGEVNQSSINASNNVLNVLIAIKFCFPLLLIELFRRLFFFFSIISNDSGAMLNLVMISLCETSVYQIKIHSKFNYHTNVFNEN